MIILHNLSQYGETRDDIAMTFVHLTPKYWMEKESLDFDNKQLSIGYSLNTVTITSVISNELILQLLS